MIISEEVKKFIHDIGKAKIAKEVPELLSQDITKIDSDITDLVLKKKIKFEGRWSSYILSDIDVIYEEDVLKMNDMFEMYGISDNLPELHLNDVALIVIYKYTLPGICDSILDTINVFHVAICGDNEFHTNEWIVLHDEN